jgi:dihydroneopterin triphosphate diphosphatase
LIMKRAPERVYAGIYHCVHGKIRPGETAWQTALREMKEETGLEPVRFWVADSISAFYEAEEDRMNLVPVFAAEVNSENIVPGEEHSNYDWLSIGDAAKKVSWQNHKNSLLSVNRMMSDSFEEKKWLEISLDES